MIAGRGYGKTRVGAETVRTVVRHLQHVNLIGATVDDARDIMVQGESGILAVCPRHERPVYKKQERRLVWPNGAESLIFTADEPERLRGKQHQFLWMDEVGSWRYAQQAWDQAMFGLRLPPQPQAVITTTPRPIPVIVALVKNPRCVVTRGSSYENRENLAADYYETVIKPYEGTRLGRQEIDGEILEAVDGALWKLADLDKHRITKDELPELSRIVVPIDPAVTSTEDSSETGIVAVGLGPSGHGFLLHDWSCRLPPHGWATRAVDLYDLLEADAIVGEINNGGDLVEATVRAVKPKVKFIQVRASRGKHKRAEPVAALHDQGRLHHVGMHKELEDQLCFLTERGYVGKGSPDRADAYVWGVTELLLATQGERLPKAGWW